MLFNSYIFVFVFFPICLLGFYLPSNHRGQGRAVQDKLFLIFMSFWFYGYFNPAYLLIMICSIGVNYLFHRILSRRPHKAVMVLAVAVDLGVLFYFKYYDFFAGTVNAVFGTSVALKNILLPLGISFFTFQQISFVADTYRGEVRDCPLVDYTLFVSFFPQLIAGPIVNHGEMLPQFAQIGHRPVRWERIAQGAGLFILGLSKKVLLADTFGAGVDYGYANIAALGRFDAVLVMVLYSLQLYFDFSGYCDMARGIGRMLGIEIPVNFDSPYKAVNIIDFWKRWHITLNRFFTKYVYIPLGGSRAGAARMYLNLMIVFLLSGLWHGAGWNYLVWGLLHGLLYAATRFWQRSLKPGFLQRQSGRDPGKTVGTAASRLLLFAYVSVAWVYFRAADISQANRLLYTAVKGPVQRIAAELAEAVRPDELWYAVKVLGLDRLSYAGYLPLCVMLAAGIYLAMIGKNAAQRAESLRYRAGSAFALAVLAVWCVLSFSQVSTFLYFNF